MSARYIVCGAFAAVAFLALGFFLIIFVPFKINEVVTKLTILQNGSMFYDAWLSPPAPIYVKFYLFSVSNPNEVINGDRPILQERGPYTYREYRMKINVSFSDTDGTVRYKETKNYIFDTENSFGNQSDKITTLNLAYISIVDKAMSFPQYVRFIMTFLVLYFKEGIFVERSAQEIIWGYEDPMLLKINTIMPVPTVVGLFVGRNGTTDGEYVIDDGVNNYEKFGQIVSYHNSSSVSCWMTNSSNRINGSDGYFIPPFRSSADTVYVFAADICRSIELNVQGHSSLNGVSMLVFSPSPRLLMSPDLNPDNRGFCLDYPHCMKSGVLNMSTCVPGAPVVISLPHFYQADQSFVENVVGLRPTEDMATRIEVEPLTGVILRAQKLLQINGVIRRNPHFKPLRKVRDTILPMGYINQSFVISNTIVDQLRSSLLMPKFIAQIVSVCTIIISSCSLFLLFAHFVLTRSTPPRRIPSSLYGDQTPLIT